MNSHFKCFVNCVFQKRTGLLAHRVTKPFSVIHTSSLANINHEYSPEKKPSGPGRKPQRGERGSQGTAMRGLVKAVGLSVQGKAGSKKASTEGKRRSGRLSGHSPANDENTDPGEIIQPLGRQSSERPTDTVTKTRPDAVPRKKMRRSNTYSNVSNTSLGLVVPIIQNEQVLGHTSLLESELANISGIQALNTSDGNMSPEPSFLQPMQKIMHKKELEPSFLESNEKIVVEVSRPLTRSRSRSREQIQLDKRSPGNNEPSFLVPDKSVIPRARLADSLHDSLEQTKCRGNNKHEDDPSFLTAPSSVDKKKRKSLRRSGRFDTEDEPVALAVLRKARKSQSSRRSSEGHIVKAKKRRSSDCGAVLKQLKSLKNFIHDKSLEIENSGNESGLSDRLQTEAHCVDRQETFVKMSASTSLVPSASETHQRQSFVCGSAKMKLLEEQKPSEASPRRTTFTVVKGAEKHSKPAGPRQLTGVLNENDELEEESPVYQLEQALGSNQVHAETQGCKFGRQMSADSLDNEDSLEEKFGSPTNVIVTEPTVEATRRTTLTVTKSRPSDALMNHQRKTNGPAHSLFASPSSRVQCIKEDEEKCTPDGNKSTQNSTFEVSAERSILLKDADFQDTPDRLPTSPRLDFCRRATHVVNKPQVVTTPGPAVRRVIVGDEDPSFLMGTAEDKNDGLEPSFLAVDEKVVIEDMVNVETECRQNKEAPSVEDNQEDEKANDTSLLDDNVFSPPAANTRRRTLSARRSISQLAESSRGGSRDQTHVTDNMSAGQIDNPAPKEDKVGLLFITLDSSLPEKQGPAKKPVVKPDPSKFLKKRSNSVTQEVDERTKRACVEPARKPVEVGLQRAAGRRTGSASALGPGGPSSRANTTRTVRNKPAASGEQIVSN